jgi:predicted nucleic acid-binding protein
MILVAIDNSIYTRKRMMLDSNVMIGYLDSKHKFHSQIKKRIQELFINGTTFFYPQPVLLEVKDYWRRKLFTETLRLHIGEGKRLYRKFEVLFIDFEKQNNGAILSDWQIKKLRQVLEPIAKEKGIEFWFAFCKQSLGSEFEKLETFLNTTNFIYARFDDGDVYPSSTKGIWPSWESANALMEKFGLASNDAAILNMVNGGNGIDGFLTNDGDLLFAIAKGGLKETITPFTFLNW